MTEDTEVLSVTVNGLEGQLFLEKDSENTRSTLTWIDAERNLQFTLMAALNETAILHIAESVSLVRSATLRQRLRVTAPLSILSGDGYSVFKVLRPER